MYIQIYHCHLDGEMCAFKYATAIWIMCAFKIPLIVIVKYLTRGGETRGEVVKPGTGNEKRKRGNEETRNFPENL